MEGKKTVQEIARERKRQETHGKSVGKKLKNESRGNEEKRKTDRKEKETQRKAKNKNKMLKWKNQVRRHKIKAQERK